MPAHSPLPPDQAARDRITDDLDTTLFVEAGAGSGKTSALVDRVLALVTSGPGRAPPRRGHHLHRKGGRRAARPHPGAHWRRRPRPTPTATAGRAAGRRWSSSTVRPSARCTRSPSACSPSTRSRRDSRPGSRCSTRSARRSPSKPAGRRSATSSWPTPHSNARFCCCSPPG